jgi:hypothetical protein
MYMASKLEIWFKTTFGGKWQDKNGWQYYHPGELWNWIDLMFYRISKFIVLKWYAIQIFYYKTKIKIKYGKL